MHNMRMNEQNEYHSVTNTETPHSRSYETTIVLCMHG